MKFINSRVTEPAPVYNESQQISKLSQKTSRIVDSSDHGYLDLGDAVAGNIRLPPMLEDPQQAPLWRMKWPALKMESLMTLWLWLTQEPKISEVSKP